MKIIPVLNIQQFEQDVPISDVYSNDIESHLERNKSLFHKPHSHDFFLCVMFSKGHGIHEIDFNKFEINDGSVFFLKPGQTHFWEFDGVCEGFIFFHTKDFYELHFSKSKLEQFPFYYSSENIPMLNLPGEVINAFESNFKILNDEYNKDLIYKKQKLASIINTIYIDLSRQYGYLEPITKLFSHRYIQTLRGLEDAIERFYKSQKSANFYANELNVSTKHLNRIVKSLRGKTTTDLITERIILEAKRLIVHSKNSLSNISELLGYVDYAYFSKVFKQKTDRTPMEFKRCYQ